MIKIKMLIPGEEPLWYRKAWKGVGIIASSTLHTAETVVVPTTDAIAALKKCRPGAAYMWSCCFAKDAPATMTFPRGICEIVADAQ